MPSCLVLPNLIKLLIYGLKVINVQYVVVLLLEAVIAGLQRQQTSKISDKKFPKGLEHIDKPGVALL